MPEVIVVASIGNRDLTYTDDDGNIRIPGDREDGAAAAALAKELGLADAKLRAVSKKLLDLYKVRDIRADRFEFPILRPGLEKVLDAASRIDKLLMIVTDQKTGKYRTGDTVHCGELLAALVNDHAVFGGNVNKADPKFLVVASAPQKPNVMYPLIRDKLSDLARTHHDAEFYALATGGTPAITDGLRHAAMNVFHDHCSVMQVDPPTAGASAGMARVVDWEPYLEDVVRAGARALVEKGNFGGALEVLKAFPRGGWPPAAIHLLKHADARVSLRVGKACKEAKHAKKAMPSASAALGNALNGVLITGSPASDIAKVNEVRFLVELALSQQRYADALVRIEQFRETARSVFSLGVLGGPFLDYVCAPLPEVVAGGCTLTTGGHTLTDWLTRNGAARQAHCWTMRKDGDKEALFYFAHAVAVVPMAPHVEERGEFAGLLRNRLFGDLAEVRNAAIHTTDGVSQASIEAVVPLGDLQTHLEKTATALFRSFGQEPTTYPYDALKDAIMDLLAR